MTVATTIGKALAKIPAGQMVAVAASGSGTIGLAFAGPPVAVVAAVGVVVAAAAAVGCYAIYRVRRENDAQPYPQPPQGSEALTISGTGVTGVRKPM